MRIEDIDRGVGNRLADADPVGGVGNPRAGGPHRGLGGAVHVPQLDTARDQLLGQILGQGFAADQGLEVLAPLPARLQQQAPGDRGGLHDGGTVLLQAGSLEHGHRSLHRGWRSPPWRPP